MKIRRYLTRQIAALKSKNFQLRHPTFQRKDPENVHAPHPAGLKKPVGLDLRWDRRLRDFQIQLEPRVSRSEAAVPKRFVRMVPGSMRNWTAVNAIQQSNLNKK